MKITDRVSVDKIKAKTTMSNSNSKSVYQWWKAEDKQQLAQQLTGTAGYLKEAQGYRYRQAALYARLYGNMALYNFIGSSTARMDQMTGLPTDRPTFNVVSSVIDTKLARISQSRPTPVFLTDDSDYKERRLAKQLNNFILGEFYQTKAYDKAAVILRDALVEGTGCMKVYETQDGKVGLERVLLTELLIDANESIHDDPRQLYQLKLMDRQVLMEMCPGYKQTVREAEQAYPDNSPDSSRTVSDLVMVVEGWHLPSAPGAKDGRHTLACTAGILFDEKYTKDKFPFVFLHDSKRMLGFWAQGTAERLMGSQMEINSLLYTISRSIKLVGVPRVFIEASSKVTKTSQNNDVGVIVEYRGTKPEYEVAPCVPQELYAQLQRLIDYSYQAEGVSQMQASSQKPAGLNSGEAIRSYDDISTDRMALLAKHYDNIFIDLAYLMVDKAMDICERDGKYQTVFPDKRGTKQIDLPKMSLLKNPFVIQCFNMSSLPKDPAGRMQKITEMIQSGMITLKEGRRLLDYPDLEQVEKLANASEERIFQMLDLIVEDGEYTPPDPFLDLDLANELTVQYINLYTSAKLEEEKAQQLRDFYSQIQALKQAAMPPVAPQAPAQPAAAPQTLPQSPLIANGNPAGAQ